MPAGAARQRRVCMRFSRGHWPQCPGTLDSDSVITCGASLISSPHRLVVRTSRCNGPSRGASAEGFDRHSENSRRACRGHAEPKSVPGRAGAMLLDGSVARQQCSTQHYAASVMRPGRGTKPPTSRASRSGHKCSRQSMERQRTRLSGNNRGSHVHMHQPGIEPGSHRWQ